MRTDDLCNLAAELAAEHGPYAIDYAQRAIVSFRELGEADRVEFWQIMSALIDDIFMQRLDVSRPITIH